LNAITLAQRRYRDVYLHLQRSPSPGKFFFHDVGADGLLTAFPGSAAVDVLIEGGVRQTRFNGDFESQRLTRQDYEARLAAADAAYARLLKVLAASIARN
jgi:hypothetical protein